tara:strand:- start:142 stop:558 length:417 start_codon:yes stop_codon:yes gene_type:complete
MKIFTLAAILNLLISNFAFADLRLWCKQQVREISEDGSTRTINMEQNWEFLITDNEIKVIGFEDTWHSMIRDKEAEGGIEFYASYFIFDKDRPGKIIIGRAIKIDRTTGNGHVSEWILDTYTKGPINSCSPNKPKLLF